MDTAVNNRTDEICFTVFTDQYGQNYTSHEMSWAALVSHLVETPAKVRKEDLPFIKLATFGDKWSKSEEERAKGKGSYRWDGNVQAVTGVEGDYDAGEYPPEKAAQLLDSAGVKCLITTTSSHTPEKPRWRLLAPCSAPFFGESPDDRREYRRRQIRKIENTLGVPGLFANESNTLSQGFYFGCVEGAEFESYIVEGEYIDLCDLDGKRYETTHDKVMQLKTDVRERFDIDEAVRSLYAEENYHQNIIRMAARFTAKGSQPEAVIEMLQTIMLASPNKGEKWQARFDYIPTAVQSAVEKFAPDDKALGSPPVFSTPKPFGTERLREAPPPIPVLVPHIIPRDVFGLVGPGGVAKTTLALRMMIHVILGRELWGEPVNDPGACLFISAEDPIEVVQNRVYEICKAMHLSDDEQETVGGKLFIEDVTGQMARFVLVDSSGNLAVSEHVRQLIKTYSEFDIKLCIADPAVFFGAGERFVNDNESTLMQAARTISRGLGCAMGYIHHMSKAGTADKDNSMHAGRGGAAFGDNSRSMLVMHIANGETKNEPKLPASYDAFDISTKMYVTVAKFSVGRRIEGPLWVLRRESNPFDFVLERFKSNAAAEAKAARAEAEKKQSDLFRALQSVVQGAVDKGEYITSQSALYEACRVSHPDVTPSRDVFRGLIDLAIGKGVIAQHTLPKTQAQGKRQTTYICGPEIPPNTAE